MTEKGQMAWLCSHGLKDDVWFGTQHADSHVSQTAKNARKAADRATIHKHNLYKESKANNYLFVAFAVETMGLWSTEALQLIDNNGSKLQEQCGDERANFYLSQKMSMAIQRGNEVAIHIWCAKWQQLTVLALLVPGMHPQQEPFKRSHQTVTPYCQTATIFGTDFATSSPTNCYACQPIDRTHELLGRRSTQFVGLRMKFL